VAAAREKWKAGQAKLDPAKLVFIDETGTNTKMIRLYGRAPKGQRAIDSQPFGHWKTTTFTFGLRCDSLVAPYVLDGAMDRDAFDTYVEKLLVPTLSPGDKVILDNLSAHKSERARQLIEARGAELIFLPPYSPDLNPIEMAISKLKTLLRKAAERSVSALWDRIGVDIDAFSPQECANYLQHAGYAPA
jgi:transposase